MNFNEARRAIRVRKIERLSRGIKGQAELDVALAKINDMADRAQLFAIMRPHLKFEATFYVEQELKN